MAELAVDRACGMCGERVRLVAETEAGYYDCPLEALLSVKRGNWLRIETRCGCESPRVVCLRAVSASALDSG